MKRNLDDDVAVLCLSRAEKWNAIDDAMIHGIDRFFGELPASIPVVVIRVKCDHLCAGADLSVIADINASAGLLASRASHRILDRIECGSVPVVAVLHAP